MSFGSLLEVKFSKKENSSRMIPKVALPVFKTWKSFYALSFNLTILGWSKFSMNKRKSKRSILKRLVFMKRESIWWLTMRLTGYQSTSFSCIKQDKIIFLTTKGKVIWRRFKLMFLKPTSDHRLVLSQRNSWRKRTLRMKWEISLIMIIWFKEESNIKRSILS